MRCSFSPLVRRGITGMIVIILLVFASGKIKAAEPDPSQYQYQLLKGAIIPVLLQESVSSQTDMVGQPVSAEVAQDIYMGNTQVLSTSDRVLGHVVEVAPPIQGRNAILKVVFDTLVLTNGIQIPIEAMVQTDNPDHSWGGELTPGTVPQIVPYKIYQLGTYGRVMYDGPRLMGKPVSFLPGERLLLVLQRPVSLYAF